MSPDLERLIELQHAESAIADARTRIAAHPQRLAEADTKFDDRGRKKVEDADEDFGENVLIVEQPPGDSA